MASWWTSRSVLAGLLGLGAAALGSVACGGSSGEAPTSTGPEADAGSEAGPEPTDGAPPDAERDAGPDAPPPPKGFCAALTPKPRFCDDFDTGELKDPWNVLTVVNGEADLDPTASTSGPASFAVATVPIASGESAHVHLRTTIKGAPTGHITLGFSMMLATTTFTKGVVAVATLDVSQNHFFTLYLRDADATAPTAILEEISSVGGTKRHLLSKLPPANTWTRATIDIDVGASKASVIWGTGASAEKVLDAAPITPTPTIDPTIRVGAVYVYGPADAFEARFDDVVLDF